MKAMKSSHPFLNVEQIELAVPPRAAINKAIGDDIEWRGTRHEGSKCPDLYVLFGGPLTVEQTHHSLVCPACRSALRAYRSADPNRLSAHPVWRRFRFFLSEWGPVLAVAILVTSIVLGRAELKPAVLARNSSGPIQLESTPVPVPHSPLVFKVVDNPSPLPWPWRECNETQARLDYLLGRGPKRAEINRYAFKLSNSFASASPIARQEAEVYWCSCLDAGSNRLSQLLAGATNSPTRNLMAKTQKRHNQRRQQ